MIRIVVADDQIIFRAGVARVLGTQPDMAVLSQAASGEELFATLTSEQAEVLLLAMSFGVDLKQVLAATVAGGMKTVLITEDRPEMDTAVLRRLDGVLTRHTSTDDLLRCIRRVASGEREVELKTESNDEAAGRRIRDSLTPREQIIVGYIVQGWKNRQIADAIGTKEQVVKNYLRSIYDKTGASDRLELALFTLHHRALAEAAAKAVASMQKPQA